MALPQVSLLASGWTVAAWTGEVLPRFEEYQRHCGSAEVLQSLEEFREVFFRRQRGPLRGLQQAIAKHAAVSAAGGEAWFLSKLLPALREWALEMPLLFAADPLLGNGVLRGPVAEGGNADTPAPEVLVYALPLLTTISSHADGVASAKRVALTRRQCRCVLALSFLGLQPRPFMHADPQARHWARLQDCSDADHDVGLIDWTALLEASVPCGVHRVACQLEYFAAWLEATGADPLRPSPAALDELVTFHRAALTTTRSVAWDELGDTAVVPLTASGSSPHVFGKQYIEGFKDADAHVDFANRQIMIGMLIPSCTQEEVMFSIRPELLLCLPLYTTLLDGEAGGVEGAATFATYSGYLRTFTYTGAASVAGAVHALHRVSPAVAPPRITYVVIMDAHVNCGRQFQSPESTRDLSKAFIAFDLAAREGGACRRIATGPWGCGAFHGDLGLKLLQQLAAVAGVNAGLCEEQERAGPGRREDAVALRYHTVHPELYDGIAGTMAHLGVSMHCALVWIAGYRGASFNLAAATAHELPWGDVAGAVEAEDGTCTATPNTLAWYWFRVLDECSDLVDPSSFTAFLICQLSDRVRATVARRDARGLPW
jgi:hypothetical protein